MMDDGWTSGGRSPFVPTRRLVGGVVQKTTPSKIHLRQFWHCFVLYVIMRKEDANPSVAFTGCEPAKFVVSEILVESAAEH